MALLVYSETQANQTAVAKNKRNGKLISAYRGLDSASK